MTSAKPAKPAKPAKSAKSAKKTVRASDSLVLHLREALDDAVAGLPGIDKRKMLVSIGWRVNERVFALVSRDARIVVRLTDEATSSELRALGAEGWRHGTRAPLRDWLLLPESMHDDADALADWLRRAWRLARDAPPPKPKRRAQRKPEARTKPKAR